MKRMLLVRHGESEWNATRRLQGQADISLSDTGRQQALALTETVRGLRPDRAIASDLRRAGETAELLGYAQAEATSALREIDVGDWTGVAITDLIAGQGEAYRSWRTGNFTPPSGESWQQFKSRTSEAVRTASFDVERLLVVCHGGVIRALLEAFIGLPPGRIIPVGPASLTILATKSGGQDDMRLELFNYSPLGPVLDAPD
jgi:probable phosphoglycerate mutase